MKTIRIVKVLVAAVGAMACMSAAQATSWNLSSMCAQNSSNMVTGCTASTNTNPNPNLVGISGWSTDANSGTSSTFQSSNLYDWGSGLGVYNTSTEPDSQHSTDNRSGVDLILLKFDKAVNLTQTQFGWTNNDSDMSLLAWTGSGVGSVSGDSYATLLSDGWALVGHYGNMGTSLQNLNTNIAAADRLYSSYWLVSAYSSSFGAAPSSGLGINGGRVASTSSVDDGGSDYFKLLTVAAETCAAGNEVNEANKCVPKTTTTPPGNDVPEPGSLALLGLGAVGLIAARRRQQNQQRYMALAV